jgi:hypothetical protein
LVNTEDCFQKLNRRGIDALAAFPTQLGKPVGEFFRHASNRQLRSHAGTVT